MNGLRGAFLAALATAGIAFAGPAEALTFNFSITNTTGPYNGTVTGQIFGLTDNSTGAASAVFVDTVPAGYPPISQSYPFDTLTAAGVVVSNNDFTVTAGAITHWNFHVASSTIGSEFLLELLTDAPAFAYDVQSNSSYLISSNGATSSVATTPLPTTWLMLLSGFLGLGLFAYRGAKKNMALAAA